MTTVNETKIKIDGSWVSLIPDATTSNKGIVQVGDGLSVTDGVISASDGGVKIITIVPSTSSCVILRSTRGYAEGYNTTCILPFIYNTYYNGSLQCKVSAHQAILFIYLSDGTYQNVTINSTSFTTVTLPSNSIALYAEGRGNNTSAVTLYIGFTMNYDTI